MLYAGIDIGSCTTKAVVIDEDANVTGRSVCRSGIDYHKSATAALTDALETDAFDSVRIVSTGYGRHNVNFAAHTKTEIACHGRGGYDYIKRAVTLIDIGGQDNKIVRLDDLGHRVEFKMNRKCAAGTGTFIEEIANRMNLPLKSLDTMARKAEKRFRIGSYCTVFASTEILSHIRAGTPAEDLIRGVFESVIDRIMEMTPLEGALLLCGGVVEYFPIIADLMQDRISGEVLIPPYPQLTGAYGAALFAREEAH
ncbi:acyl-CoA dehydratase activase [Thermodesulfobacteriota bacterium]